MVMMSKNSKHTLSQLCLLINDPTLQAWKTRKEANFNLSEFITWLKQPTLHDSKTRLVLESFRTALLKDIHDSRQLSKTSDDKEAKKSASNVEKLKYNVLMGAGAMLTITGGFSSITALLSIFSVPTALLFGIGFVFSAISAVFFYQFDRVELSKMFGVELQEPEQLLDVCIKQITQIKKIRKQIDEAYGHTTDVRELQTHFEMLEMLDCCYAALETLREEYKEKLKNPLLNTLKKTSSTLKAGLVVISGFLGGQSIALAIGGLFLPTIAVTAWPIVAVSLLLSLSALGLYCYMQRSAYENRIGSLLGLDRDKIEEFINTKDVEKQKNKLSNLEHKVEEKIIFKLQMNELYNDSFLKGQLSLTGFFKPERAKGTPKVHFQEELGYNSSSLKPT